jgi:dipeptidyl aminopeptidase/acylaminoacyl peptidase
VLYPQGRSGPAVELFYALPPGSQPHPAVLYVHGHQEQDRIGGRDMVDSGGLDRIARGGTVAASVSQPGYGGSSGPPDYCGPATQQAIRDALAFVRTLPAVDAKRMALYGVSRGAIAAAVVAAQEPDLRGLILVAGIYDLGAAYPRLLPGMQVNLRAEAGLSPEALGSRSGLRTAASIHAAVLILHGRQDMRAPPDQAPMLADALRAQGADVTLRMFDTGHTIPFIDRAGPVNAFLARVLAGGR